MPPETKQDVLRDIALLLGRPSRTVSTGSTEPRELFEDIASAIGVPDVGLPKPEFAEQLSRALGQAWDPSCDSRNAPSGGGSTVTLVGLQRLREGLREWAGAQRGPAAPGFGSDAEAGAVADVKLAAFAPLPDPALRPDAYEAEGNASLQRALQEKALLGHRQTLNLLAQTLQAAGAECWDDRASVDLVASWSDGLSALFEVKTVPVGAVGPTRLAVSQVLEYAYRLRRWFSEPVLGIVYDREPLGPSWLVPYLIDDRRINVIWRDADSFRVRGPEARLLAARVRGINLD